MAGAVLGHETSLACLRRLARETVFVRYGDQLLRSCTEKLRLLSK